MSRLEVPNAERIDDFILESFKEVRTARRVIKDSYEFVELRASSFPVCPRAYHISRRLPRKHRPLQQEKFLQEAPTLMGTALHLVLQKWFGIVHAEHFYGNWECIFCGRVKKHRYGLQRCKKCDVEMVYKEYAVRKQKGIPYSGHIDGILRFGNGLDILLDFKGAYREKMKGVRDKKQPVKSHFYQTNAYAWAINKGKVDCGDLTKIRKIIILYIERGRPNLLWHPCQVTPSKKAFRQSKELIKVGKQSLKDLRIPQGLCTSIRDENATWCEWKHVCWSSSLRSILDSKVYPELKFKKNSPQTLDLVLQAENLQNQP